MEQEQANEASGRHCAYCLVFTPDNNVRCCGGCNRRAYCSRVCQKSDWSEKGDHGQVHKNFCKMGCGEEGLDWEVVPVEGMGLGIIAKRFIPAKFQIMVDPARPISHPLMQDLTPIGGTSLQKTQMNGFSFLKGVIPLVCARLSRMNHSCDPNSAFHFDHTFKVAVVYALRDIEKGEEIFRDYRPINDYNQPTLSPETKRQVLRNNYGIHCSETCHCRNAEFLQLLENARKLKVSASRLGSRREICKALDEYEKLLDLQDSINSTYVLKIRTLQTAYKLAILNRATRSRAEGYLRQAYDIAITIISSPNSIDALRIKKELVKRFGT